MKVPDALFFDNLQRFAIRSDNQIAAIVRKAPLSPLRGTARYVHDLIISVTR
jgi:hypothetical protein